MGASLVDAGCSFLGHAGSYAVVASIFDGSGVEVRTKRYVNNI